MSSSPILELESRVHNMMGQFLGWVQQHPTTISAMANILFVVVWVVYLHVFIRQLRRRHRPYLEIQHAQGSELSSACLLVNMGQELIDVKAIAVRLTGHDGAATTASITDYRRISGQDRHVSQIVRQGPLYSGEMLVIGRVEDLVKFRDFSANGQADDIRSDIPMTNLAGMEIWCVALHGSTDTIMGAKREFSIRQDGERYTVHPTAIRTKQLVSRRQRKHLEQWCQELQQQDTPNALLEWSMDSASWESEKPKAANREE